MAKQMQTCHWFANHLEKTNINAELPPLLRVPN
ncbi:Uncharacterised protein [Yersinia frederiksenii]|nr:Uncharacterised protein [Yersinia frederiksenii]